MIMRNWVVKWQMKSSVDKCTVMLLGEKNHPNYTCIMRGSKSAITARENDLSIVANFEKMTGQGWAGVRKANKTLGITRKGKKKTKQTTSLSLCINLWCGPVLGSICSFSVLPPSYPHSPDHIQRARRGTGDSQKALALRDSCHARTEQVCWDSMPVKREGKGETGLHVWQEPAAAENKLYFQPQLNWSIWLPAAQ